MGVLVGKLAPQFKAKAVIEGRIVNDFSLVNYLGKNIVFFFYPLDFTFVCPTELHAFQEKMEEFDLRDTQIVACSVDSPYCHVAWLNTPKSKGGIQGVTYPLISDMNRTITSEYDVLIQNEGIAYRGLFIIDKKGIVRHQVVNDLPLGRNVDEVIRMLDALVFFEENGEVCPANWQKGYKSMKPTSEGLEQYFTSAGLSGLH